MRGKELRNRLKLKQREPRRKPKKRERGRNLKKRDKERERNLRRRKEEREKNPRKKKGRRERNQRKISLEKAQRPLVKEMTMKMMAPGLTNKWKTLKPEKDQRGTHRPLTKMMDCKGKQPKRRRTRRTRNELCQVDFLSFVVTKLKKVDKLVIT